MRSKIVPEEMIGKTYERLTVKESLYYKGNHTTKMLCDCSCGKENLKVIASQLLSGKTRSCGCLKVEAIVKRSLKHGGAKRGGMTAEYSVWRDIHKRCSDTDNQVYGGKGIKVDPSWSEFSVFLSDMGTKPHKNSTIERLDNSLGYSKENCVWECRSTQSAHRTKQSNNTSGAIGVIETESGYRVKVAWHGKKKEFLRHTLEKAVIVRDLWVIVNGLPHTLNVTSATEAIIRKVVKENPELVAGAKWRIIEAMIEETVCLTDNRVVVFSLSKEAQDALLRR